MKTNQDESNDAISGKVRNIDKSSQVKERNLWTHGKCISPNHLQEHRTKMRTKGGREWMDVVTESTEPNP